MSLEKFTTQASWTQPNILAVSEAIKSCKIKTIQQLQNIIGVGSIKKYPNGKKTIGSQMLEFTLSSRSKISKDEYQFYTTHTTDLKTFPIEKEKLIAEGLLKFKETDNFKNYKAKKPNFDIFIGNVNNFITGRYIAEEGIKTMIENVKKEGREINRDEAVQLILTELEEIERLNNEESKLFVELSKKVPIDSAFMDSYQKHKEFQINKTKLIREYLKNPVKINDLITEASNYQKYLKYKAKYLALKKQLEQKN